MPGVGGSNVYGRSSGTWEPAEDMQGRYSGAWAQADEVYVRHGGAWVKVWEFNTAPPAVSSLAVAYSPNGTSWDAVATWSLPAEPDLDTVYVWTIDGAAQPWVQLANTATTHTYDVPSGSSAEVTVYLEDTGGLTSPTAQASGGVSPLDARKRSPSRRWTGRHCEPTGRTQLAPAAPATRSPGRVARPRAPP